MMQTCPRCARCEGCRSGRRGRWRKGNRLPRFCSAGVPARLGSSPSGYRVRLVPKELCVMTHVSSAQIDEVGARLSVIIRSPQTGSLGASRFQTNTQHEGVGSREELGHIVWTSRLQPHPIGQGSYLGSLPGARRSRETFCCALAMAEALRVRWANICASIAASDVCGGGAEASSGSVAMTSSSGACPCIEFPMAQASRRFRSSARPQDQGREASRIA
jgi:hypothetical protein